MIENEVKACENWFSPLFYLFLFLFCLFFLALARTSPCQQSLSFASSILAFSRRLSHSKKRFERLCSPTGTSALERRREVLCNIIVCYNRFDGNGVFSCYVFVFVSSCIFCFVFVLCFFDNRAFLPIALQFLFHSACNVTTYHPSNTLRKSGKQVTALARVQASEKQLKRKWTTSSQGKQATFRDANIYSSRKDV